MAAKAIVAERQSIAIAKLQEHAAALSGVIGVDAMMLGEYVKGDAAYQEMIRTEQLAELLGAVRAKVTQQDASNAETGDSTPEQQDATQDSTEGDGPTFHGHPLSFYDGMSDEKILALPGIGQATLKKIRQAQDDAA